MVAARAALLLAAAVVSCAAGERRVEFVQAVEFPYHLYPRQSWERELVWLKAIGVRTVAFSIPRAWHETGAGEPDLTGRTGARRDLTGLVKLLRRLDLHAWLHKPAHEESRAWTRSLERLLEPQTVSHGGPVAWVEGGWLSLDAPAPPEPVTAVSATDPAALARSRRAIGGARGSLLWRDLEDTLAPAGSLAPGAPLYRKNFQTSISTSFELDFWGKLRRASEAARAQALGTRYAKDTVELTLVSQLVGSYLNLRALDAQLALSRDTLATRRDNADILRARARSGLASDLEVEQARGAVAAIEAQIADLARSRGIAENQLGLLTGQLDLAIAPGDLRNLPLPPLPPAGLPSSLLDARPDIRQAEAELAAANAQIGVAKAALYPSISLTGNYGSQSRELSDLFSGPANIWSLGIGLDLPLFDAGKRSARVDQASAQQKQALAGYIAAVRSAFTDVRDALVASAQYAQGATALQAQVDAATRSLALAQKRYDAGYSRYLEVLDARRSANEASLALVRNRQAQLAEVVSLYAALGGGWEGLAAGQGRSEPAVP